MQLINNKNLLRLNIHILTLEYMKKEAFCFIKIIGNYEKTNEDSKEINTIFN